MATYSRLVAILSSIATDLDLTTNSVQMQSIFIGTSTPVEITKTIAQRLINLQNATDVDATYHTHDGRYYTQTQLNTRTSTSGATLVGVERKVYANISGYSALIADTLANYNQQALLDAVNTSLGNISTDFLDTAFRISDDGDTSKKIAFQASGITTGTVRTITMANADVNLTDVNNAVLVGGSRAFTANQSMGGFRLTNVADPTAAQDAATKFYVDAVALGLAPKKAVRLATTADITLSAPQTIDGVSAIAGDRILVKNQAAPEENGIYVVAAGSWTRATDFDSLSPIDEINGAWVPVQFGTANAGKIFVQYGTVATLDTDPINFEFYNPISSLIGGDMVTVSGSTISVDLATASGLVSTNPGNAAGQLSINLESSNPSLQISSNQLGVKFDTNGTSGNLETSSGGIRAKTDGTTLETSGNNLRIKDLGVSTAKLAATSVTKAKLNSDVVSFGLTQESDGSLAVRGAYAPLINGNAGTLNAGAVVYLTSTASTFDAADADALATAKGVIGVLLANTATTATGQVQVAGRCTVQIESGSLTPGERVYLSSTAGKVTMTAPTASGACVVLVGIACSTTEVVLQPALLYQVG